jgi:hypothetical protein
MDEEIINLCDLKDACFDLGGQGGCGIVSLIVVQVNRGGYLD